MHETKRFKPTYEYNPEKWDVFDDSLSEEEMDEIYPETIRGVLVKDEDYYLSSIDVPVKTDVKVGDIYYVYFPVPRKEYKKHPVIVLSTFSSCVMEGKKFFMGVMLSSKPYNDCLDWKIQEGWTERPKEKENYIIPYMIATFQEDDILNGYKNRLKEDILEKVRTATLMYVLNRMNND